MITINEKFIKETALEDGLRQVSFLDSNGGEISRITLTVDDEPCGYIDYVRDATGREIHRFVRDGAGKLQRRFVFSYDQNSQKTVAEYDTSDALASTYVEGE